MLKYFPHLIKFTSPDYIKTSKSWTFVDPRYGNPTIDINTWNTITSDNYITTNTRMSSNQHIKDTTKNTTNIRKLQKLNKVITNKIKRIVLINIPFSKFLGNWL